MKLTNQQKQTKTYFEKFANEWNTKAKRKSKKIINVIKQRNDYVEKISKKYILKNNGKTLDVGCGSGELVISLLKNGFDAYGIDFSNSMIKKGKAQAKRNKFEQSRFFCDSFFDFKFKNKYDLISANGFIEYISEKKFDDFLEISSNLLTKNGILVVNSRNRLFNIFSFNDFTKAEMKNKNTNNLIEECIEFNNNKNFKELLKNKNKSKINNNLKKHSKTGIDVDTRFQYTPYQLIEKLNDHNFTPIDIQPIHIHVFTTGARTIYSDFHNEISNHIQSQNTDNFRLIPQSSSFMIVAKRK